MNILFKDNNAHICSIIGHFCMLVFAFILLFTAPFNALALDEYYINGSYKEEQYWYSCPANHISADDGSFECNFKSVLDAENGCFYLCINFKDINIPADCDDNITLGVSVKNSRNSYYFSIDENGFTQDSSGIKDNFNICYSFDEASCRRQGGKIYFALELKNKIDRLELNKISCEYYCGDYVTREIVKDVVLDMRPSETTKAATSKKQTTKKTTSKKSTTKKATKAGTAKHTQSSTKYVPTGTVSGIVTKQNDNINTTDVTNVTEEANVFDYKSERTKPAKALIAASALIIAAGVVCALVGNHLMKREENKSDNNQ